MKKLSKTLLAISAVSAVSMAMAASAMAAPTADYNDTEKTVTLSGIEDTGASQTLLIVPEGKETNVQADDIIHIDQDDVVDGVNGSFNDATITLNAEKLEAGTTYVVRIGGTTAGTIQEADFTVPGGGGEVTTDTIIIGDIDGSNRVDSDDLTAEARWVALVRGAEYQNETVGTVYTLSDAEAEPNTITVGDIDGSTRVDSDDVTAMARWIAVVRGDGYDNSTVGSEVEVNIAATE